jgi:hypothetical protein
LLGITTLTWLCLVYTGFVARRVLGSHTGSAPPVWGRRSVTLLASVMLCLVYLAPPLAFSQMMNFRSTQTPLQTALTPTALLAVIVSPLLVSFTMFSGTWLVLQSIRLVRPLRCPSCGGSSHHSQAVGRTCEHCSCDLASWLYVGSHAPSSELSDKSPQNLLQG